MSMRAQIQARVDNPVLIVDVPRWGTSIGIRKITVRQRLELERLAQQKDELGLAVEAMLLACIGPDSMPAFVAEDREWLAEQSADIVLDLLDKILDHNAMRRKEIDEAKKP